MAGRETQVLVVSPELALKPGELFAMDVSGHIRRAQPSDPTVYRVPPDAVEKDGCLMWQGPFFPPAISQVR